MQNMTVRGRVESASREALHEELVEFAASANGDMLGNGLWPPSYVGFSHAWSAPLYEDGISFLVHLR